MKEKILGHRILLQMETKELDEKRSDGGIILATKETRHAEDSEIGTVVGIGPTAYADVGNGEPWVEVGDKVLIARYNGQLVPHNKRLRIVNDEDILLKIED